MIEKERVYKYKCDTHLWDEAIEAMNSGEKIEIDMVVLSAGLPGVFQERLMHMSYRISMQHMQSSSYVL
ncbi:MAG TPA: hypothetical protein V6C99_09830 [Oculatellaceae cyanobacterium]